MKNITSWVNKNRKEFMIISFILIIAAFFRLYQIDQYMTFLGDEGRDAIVIKRILTEYDFPLLGPATSVGGMYLGPLYYYMMAVPMALSWLNPVAAAVMVALLGIISVGLIYYLSREWFGKIAAVVAASLYALSPVAIIYSKSSWNPNPAPFFTLMAMLGLYKARQTKNYRYFILVGISLAFVIQMHYLALILLPIFGILWIYDASLFFRSKVKFSHFIPSTIIAILLFLFLMSPLVIFDLKYDFMNYKAFSTFFTNRETTVNLNPINSIARVIPIYQNNLIGRYMSGSNLVLSIFIAVIVLLPIILAIFNRLFRKKTLYWPLLALGIWLIGGVLGLILYKQNIYDHYLGFLSPAPYILLGALVWYIKNTKYQLVVAVLIIAVLGFLNLQKSPLLSPPQNQLMRTQQISQFVLNESGDKPYNFALLAKHNYDSAYQYYLDLFGKKPMVVPFDITDQLFVVCEDPICEPINNPKYEIAAFGWSKIENEKEINGVRVFKLIHQPQTNAIEEK